MNDTIDRQRPRDVEEDTERRDVGLPQRLEAGGARRRDHAAAREVKDEADTVEGLTHRERVEEVGLEDARARSFEKLRTATITDDGGDAVATSDQRFREVCANESGRAGDENLSRHDRSLTNPLGLRSESPDAYTRQPADRQGAAKLMMATRTSIRGYYRYALAEGEGVGTAYEYFAKGRVVRHAMARVRRGGTLLVAGVPEKYGTSVDFLVAARDSGVSVVVVDERQSALDKARRVVSALPELAALPVEWRLSRGLEDHEALPHFADCAFSCEVLQRVPPERRQAWADALCERCPSGAIFAPNASNQAHAHISKLGAVTLSEIRAAMGPVLAEAGYLDMPPFPPGITRSSDQRQKAASGVFERVAMRALEVFARSEPVLPVALKRRSAHIVYARWGS